MIHYDTLELQPPPLGAGFEIPELDLESRGWIWRLRGWIWSSGAGFRVPGLDLEAPGWI